MANRVERVTLELDDRFTPGIARAAAAAHLLDQRLDRVSGSSAKSAKGLESFEKQTKSLGVSADRSGSSIDKLSGRLGLLSRAVMAVGPSAIPALTGTTVALAGMTTQVASLALGAGVVVAAFKGVGGALEALNKAQLQPTTANIEKARAAMQSLSPQARAAVRALQEMRPVLAGIRDAGAAGFFPGFVDGLHSLETMAPRLESLFNTIGTSAGDLFADAAKSLSSEEWAPFFAFIEHEAPTALTTLGHSVGNVTKGLAELWMAMDPLSDDFSAGLLHASEGFEKWAEGVSKTEGFQEFLAYVEDTGPQVLETVGSIADALLQIGEAAAPMGGPVLRALEGIADAVAKIADSPIGPVIMAAATAMSALSLATKGFNSVANMSFGTGGGSLRSGVRGFTADLQRAYGFVAMTREESQANMAAKRRVKGTVGKVAGGGAAIGALAGANAAGLDTSYTILGAAAGSVIPGVGTAAGAAAGALLDLGTAFKKSADEAGDFNDVLRSGDIDAIQRAMVKANKELDDFGKKGSLAKTWDNLAHLGDLSKSNDADRGAILKDRAARSTDAFTAALDKEARAAGYASEAERVHAETLRATAEATVAAVNASLGYEGALRNMREAVKGVTHAFTADGQVRHNLTKDQQDAASALFATGKAWGDLTQAERVAAGGTRAARADFVKTAVQLGMSKTAARTYADALFNVPPRVKTKVEADTAQAMANLRIFKALYGSLRSKTITLTTRAVPGPVGGLLSAANAAANYNPANGGTIPFGGGPVRRAEWGSTVPKDGMPYADRYPYLLAPGEEVISNRYGQADRHRSLLKAINAGRLADGGTAGRLANGGTARGVDTSGIRALGDEAKKSAKEIQKEREQRRKARIARAEGRVEKAQSLYDERVQERDQFGASVADRFRSDLFASSRTTSGWAKSSSKSSWRDKLTADIAQASEVNALQAKLGGLGLDGKAAQALFADADVATLRAFAGYSPAEIAEYEALFNQRDALLGAAGAGAAQSVFGAGVGEAQRDLNQSNAELAALRGKKRRGHGPNRQQRDSYHLRDRHHGGRAPRGGGRGGGNGRNVQIYVEGDSSRDPNAMAQETARRLAFEGGA